MKKPRDHYVMVSEDDQEWLRFWNAYPMRVAKKEARKAWAKLNPSPELVTKMVQTLTWQSQLWAVQGYGTPYPASWLNAERWTDEMPISSLVNQRTARALTSGAAFVAGGEK